MGSVAPIDGLEPFSGRNYLNLETLRRNGTAVATPVWFARDGNILYAYSLAAAGKVRRIRNNPRIRIAPCDIRGRLEGEWMPAQARLVDGPEAIRAHGLLDRKYGWLKRIGGILNRWRRREYAVVAMTLLPATE
jgi:PPOX class probable F420-dependent enzyme